ncbi:MAG: hypothetical protein PWP31_784 [Clostridia bacterium]|nr:hypothetical protein [Clostridia bacterium]
MGLTRQSCSNNACREIVADKKLKDGFVIALAGNPNTGKSTVFNALTGLNQHTGNWPGKTVLKAEGSFSHRDKRFTLVDLPGTYSLLANSVDEQVARDFICFARPDVTIVVTDSTCLERNLNLVLQVMEITPRVVVCANLIDEAERKKIRVDIDKLAKELGVPVIATAAREGRGLSKLKDIVYELANGSLKTSPKMVYYDSEVEKSIEKIENQLRPLLPKWLNSRWVALRLLEGDQSIIDSIIKYSNELPEVTVGRDVNICPQ